MPTVLNVFYEERYGEPLRPGFRLDQDGFSLSLTIPLPGGAQVRPRFGPWTCER